MRNFLARSTIAVLLAQSLLSSTTIFGQQPDRRDKPPTESPQSTSKVPDQWQAPPTGTIVSLDRPSAAADSKQEPTIRVALAIDAHSATISTSGGHLMNATDA